MASDLVVAAAVAVAVGECSCRSNTAATAATTAATTRSSVDLGTPTTNAASLLLLQHQIGSNILQFY